MNSTFLKQNLKVILAVGLGLIVVVSAIIFYVNQNSNQSKSNNEESKITEEKLAEKTTVIEPAKTPAENLSVVKNTKYTGTSLQILTSALSFPNSVLTFSDEDNFSLNASGLSLSLLGNSALSVQGQYPIVEINASGKYIVSQDKSSIDLKVSVLNFIFNVNAKPVDEATSQLILTEVAKSGIILPVVSQSSPVVVNVNIQINSEPALTVKSTTNSVYYLSFVGTK